MRFSLAKNWTLALLVGFGIYIALFIGASVFTYFQVQRLSDGYDTSTRLTRGARDAADVSHMAAELYRIVGMAVVSADAAKAEEAWKPRKEELLRDLATVEKSVDAEEEKEYFAEGKDAITKFVDVFEKEMLPALKDGSPREKIVELNAKIDDLATDTYRSLVLVAQAMQVESEEEDERFVKTKKKVIWASVWLCAFGVLLGVTLAVVIARAISVPIKRLIGVLEQVSSGQLSSSDALEKGDHELGRLSAAIDGNMTRLRDVTRFIDSIGRGDLSQTLAAHSDGDEVASAGNKMVAELRQLVTRIQTVLEGVIGNSTTMSATGKSLSDGASEQASSLEEISASMAEISSQATSNAETSGRAANVGESVKSMAVSGQTEVATMQRSMGEINESSQQIARIIKVIDDIAFQTNLLALNAAVEAARAGAHGKGFAVVADEVRNLAGRSAKAAKETSDLIEASKARVETGMAQAEKTTKAFQGIAAGITDVTSLIGEISTASREQANGTGQISSGLQQIDVITQRNAALAMETASNSESVMNQARDLGQLVGYFRV